MLLIKWQQLSEEEKTEILNKGLKVSIHDTRFKQEQSTKTEVKRTKTNRRNNPKYSRVESYLDDNTKHKLDLIKKYRTLSYSEVIEGLIQGEYDLLFK